MGSDLVFVLQYLGFQPCRVLQKILSTSSHSCREFPQQLGHLSTYLNGAKRQHVSELGQ